MKKVSKNFGEAAMRVIFTLCGFAAAGAVAVIAVYMVAAGLPAILKIGPAEFLLGTRWAPTATDAAYGILPFILSSLCATLGAVIVGVPVGLLCAIFLAKIADKRLAKAVSPAVELLAGIPSVVYGLLGMMVLTPFLKKVFGLAKGSSLLAAILVLAVMILPVIVSVAKTALEAVPREYEEASLALGASWEETVFKVSLPAAKSGIAAGVVLGVGRAIGEAMAVMMVAGNVPNMPKLLQSVCLLTTGVAKEMGYARGLHREALFSIALVLFVFIMAINSVLNGILKREKK